MSQKKIIADLQKLGLKIGSVNITTSYNDSGELKKSLFYGHDWHQPSINNKMNGYYVITGKESNIVVLDLDNMDNEHCQHFKTICDSVCSMIVKTRKGYHYYFQYDDDFSNKIQGRDEDGNVIFDFQSNGQQIICPPSKYINHDTKEQYEYKLVKFDNCINPMSDEVKEYLNNFKMIPKEKPVSISNKKVKKVKELQPINEIHDIIYEDKIIIKLIDGLDRNRSIETANWLTASYCFNNSGYDLKYFDYFSKLHYPKYNEKDVSDHYKILKIRKDIDTRLTVATLWQWLKEDNEDIFGLLKKELNEDLYKIEIGKYEIFSLEKLNNLVNQDKTNLKDDYYYTLKFTKSFQYFNHFFVWMCPQATIYKIDDNGPLPYAIKSFPDLNVEKTIRNTDKKGNIITKKKIYNFVDLWMNSGCMTKIEKFIFNPDPLYIANKDSINLFNGFPLDKNNDGIYDITLIQDYLDHINNVCNNDKQVYEYVINWISHIFQKPHIRTTTTLVLYSDTQGVGKNLIFDVISKILGKYYLKLKSTTEFAANFNSHHQNKLLGVCDEVNARAKDLADELKDAITRNTMWITYKGKESYEIDDYNNYVLTTNNEGVLRVPQGDRRFMIIGCKEQKVSKDHVSKILKILNDDKLLLNVFNFFKNRDISNFNPKDIIMTSYKKTLILNDLPAYIRMLKFNADQYSGIERTSKQLYIESIEYAKNNKLPSTYTDQKCYKDLQIYFKDYYKRLNNQRVYDFPENFHEVVDEVIASKINCNQ